VTVAVRLDRVRVDDVLDGYARLVRQRVEAGWLAYLATMMFDHVPGSTSFVLAQMRDEVDRFYRRLVTRVVRRPAGASSAGRLPILIAAPDLRVSKTGKSLRDVRVNDGLHLHGMLLVPPVSRLCDVAR
jgi:hypothetical protein